MIEINDKKDCCGCNACGDICHVQAISFQTDHEGFWYPVVDKNKSIDAKTGELIDYSNDYYGYMGIAEMMDKEKSSDTQLTQEELEAIWAMRRALSNNNPQEVTETIIENLAHTRNNKDFIQVIKKVMVDD